MARLAVTERAFPTLSPASRELPLRGSLTLPTASLVACHPERSRSFGEGVSRKATIRSKTEERKRRRDLVRTLAIRPHDVTFLTGRYEALKRDPARPTDARFCLFATLNPQKFDFGSAFAQDDRLQVMRRSPLVRSDGRSMIAPTRINIVR